MNSHWWICPKSKSPASNLGQKKRNLSWIWMPRPKIQAYSFSNEPIEVWPNYSLTQKVQSSPYFFCLHEYGLQPSQPQTTADGGGAEPLWRPTSGATNPSWCICRAKSFDLRPMHVGSAWLICVLFSQQGYIQLFLPRGKLRSCRVLSHMAFVFLIF